MNLTDHDLKQIDGEYLSKLTPEQLRKFSEKILDDLRVARDRLNQNASNSSKPSGSHAPWEKAAKQGEESISEEGVSEGKKEELPST